MATSTSASTGTQTTRYQPVAPLSASYVTSLSQDVVMTDTIPVDSNSTAPTAPFTNPASGGWSNTPAVEALVITNGKLGHAARDRSTDAGWKLVMPFGGVAALEVAAGTAYAGTADSAVYGLFQDATTLQSTRLQANGTDWSHPTPVLTGSISYLRSAYSPAGRLVVYGQTPTGNLVIAYQPTPGAAFSTQTYAMPHPLSGGNHYLCLTNETSWTLAANVGGHLWIYTGVLDGSSTEPASGGQAQNYPGSIDRVVMGYWSPYQAALMFLFVNSTGALQVWSSSSGSIVSIPPAFLGSAVTSAAGHVYVDPDTGIDTINVYTIDGDLNLAVLHQSPTTPWNEDGTPKWAPALPLDQQIAGLAIDASPSDAPALFAMSGDTYSLRLHHQDAHTRMWSGGPVLQAGPSAFEVVRFRAEVNMIDAAGRPLVYYPVSVAVAPNYSAIDLWVAGQTYPISSSQGADLVTDATGKLTIAALTLAGLAAPELVLTAEHLPTPLPIQPAQSTHTYLSGDGTLNPTNPTTPRNGAGPLPVFDADGAALQSATVNGQRLAPTASGNAKLAGVAASSIQQTAMVGLNTTPPGVTGYKVSLSDPTNPSFQVLHSQDEVSHHVTLLGAEPPGSVWSDIGDFFADIWHGIRNGLIAIKDFIVDTVKKVVNFTLEIAGEIKRGIQLALKGLEQAAHFIAGVFQAIAADVEKVIDWLKALFDFGAIWRTKMAFEQSLDRTPAYVKQVVQLGTKAADGWFAKQEATVNQAFEAARRKYAGTSYQDQPHFQPSGGPPNDTTPIAGGAKASDFANNVHHNWLQDKVSSYAGTSTLGVQPNSAIDTPWQAFVQNVDRAKDDFVAALKSLEAGIETTITDPNAFGSVAIPDFLTAVQELVNGLLKLCDAILDGFMAIATVAMDALEKILTTEIDIGILKALWSWIASVAGYPEDNKLTVSALIALAGAFPTTIIYKLIVGVDHEPFPSTTDAVRQPAPMLLGAQFASAMPPFIHAMPPGAVLASAILQTFYVIPAFGSDILGSESPTWLTVLQIGLSAVIWVTKYGFPDLSAVTWVEIGLVAVNLSWISRVIYLAAESVITARLKWIKENRTDIVNVLLTVYGVGSLILQIVLEFVSKPDTEEDVAGLLLPLPSLFAFLNLPTFRDDPEVAPFAVGTKIAFDFIGYLGGGIAEVIDAKKLLGDAAPLPA